MMFISLQCQIRSTISQQATPYFSSVSRSRRWMHSANISRSPPRLNTPGKRDPSTMNLSGPLSPKTRRLSLCQAMVSRIRPRFELGLSSGVMKAHKVARSSSQRTSICPRSNKVDWLNACESPHSVPAFAASVRLWSSIGSSFTASVSLCVTTKRPESIICGPTFMMMIGSGSPQ